MQNERPLSVHVGWWTTCLPPNDVVPRFTVKNVQAAAASYEAAFAEQVCTVIANKTKTRKQQSIFALNKYKTPVTIRQC